VQQAARDSIPPVAPVFWSFRLMVVFGLLMLAYFVMAVLYTLRNQVQHQRWFLRAAVWMIPIPFLANELGWLTAELGRQPWTVFGVLPTWMSASTHSVGYMVFSLAGFVLLYSIFIAIEMALMVRAIRQGPDEPGSGDARSAPRPAIAPRPAYAAASDPHPEG
jgi:cytochrome d ubiquinol oxidase subunit I